MWQGSGMPDLECVELGVHDYGVDTDCVERYT